MSQTMVCAMNDLIKGYENLMTDPSYEKQWACFLETLNVLNVLQGTLKVKWKQNFARCFVINTSQLKNRTKYTFLWLFASHRLAHKFAAHSRCWKYASGHFKLLFWTQRSFMTFAHGGNLVISLFDNWLLCRRYMTRWFYLNIKLQLPGGFIMPLFHKIMR